MILRRITTENFRNLAGDPIDFHSAVNLFVGRNGQGKTNLLEAIYFLATTKSFRTSRAGSLFRFGSPSLFAGGVVRRGGVDRHVSAGLESGEARRRVLLVNGERVALPAYVATLCVFAYSAARLEIVRGGPEERRRFIDRGAASLNPSYLDDLTRFGRVLRQRNALLAEIGRGQAKTSELAPWNEEFVAAATVIAQARARYTEALGAAFRRIVAEHAYRVANMEIVYRGSDESELREKMDRMSRFETRARTSLVGPQRDGIDFLVGGRAAQEVLSGGEVKMIVLFLKFAKLDLFRARFDEPAIFLLDDVDAELDLEILQQLLTSLPPETQVFATSAKERFLEALEAGPHRRLVVENGRVTTATDFA